MLANLFLHEEEIPDAYIKIKKIMFDNVQDFVQLFENKHEQCLKMFEVGQYAISNSYQESCG